MSTTATPQPAATVVTLTKIATASEGWAWLRAHERIVIVAMVIALSAWGLQKWDNHAAAAADTRAAIADAHAADVDKTAAQSVAILQQALAEKNATNALLAQENAALASAISSRQTTVIVQQKTDATLPPTALAQKIATLSGAPPAEVTIDGDAVRLGRNASVSVAQTLELVPVLQANLKDETTIAQNTQTSLDNANSIISQVDGVITDLNAVHAADSAKCTADLNQVKADAKKNNFKWFKRGFIVGFLGGLYAHALGL
jgi:hypothetical protein